MSLKVKFLGALDTVTGSCSLLHYQRADAYYLIDCGMYLGFPGSQDRNRCEFDFEPAKLRAVFLTHAHIDHCGLLPRLVAEGFKGPIFCTQATAELTSNALFDSVQLDGLHTKNDVRKVTKLFKCPDADPQFQWGHFYPFEFNLYYGFLRTAHVPGSVAVEFRLNVSPSEQITVLFSGDVGPGVEGRIHGGLLKSRHYPNPSTNFLVIESTYGGRTRDPEAGQFDSRIQALTAVLRDAFARSPEAVVLFPAFTLQRTQEVVADLHYVFTHTLKSIGAVPTVFVDSALAGYHTRAIHKDFLRINSKGKRISLNDVSPLFSGLSPQEVDALVNALFDTEAGPRVLGESGAQWQLVYGSGNGASTTGPSIFVSGSGTCVGGPILKHLSEHLANPAATVVLTGYQPPGLPGDVLKKIHALPADQRGSLTVELGETSIPGSKVKAALCDLAPFFSGHADEAGLVDFTLRNDTDKPTPPLTVFINHGVAKTRLALKERLEAVAKKNPPGFRQLRKVFLPEAESGWFDFVKNDWVQDGSQVGSAQIAELKEMMFEVLHNQREILRILKNR